MYLPGPGHILPPVILCLPGSAILYHVTKQEPCEQHGYSLNWGLQSLTNNNIVWNILLYLLGIFLTQNVHTKVWVSIWPTMYFTHTLDYDVVWLYKLLLCFCKWKRIITNLLAIINNNLHNTFLEAESVKGNQALVTHEESLGILLSS
jgi:hypothetical protein